MTHVEPVFGDDLLSQVEYKCGESGTSVVWVEGYYTENRCTAGGNHTVAQGDECSAWGTTQMASQSYNAGYWQVQTIAAVPCSSGGGGSSSGGGGSSGGGLSGNPPYDNEPDNPPSYNEPVIIDIGIVDNLPPLLGYQDIISNELDDLIENTQDEWIFDSSIDIDNSMHFTTVEEFITWKEEINFGYENSPPPTLRIDGKYDCLARITDVLTNIDVEFVYTKDDPSTPIIEAKVDVSSVISGLTGLTIGTTWEEKRIETDDSSLSNYSIIRVKANLMYNIFFNGIGAIYTEPVTVTVMVDKMSAEIYNMYYD